MSGPNSARHDPLTELARRVFGYQSLRPGKREAIESAVGGTDTLVVMSTGSGKSAIYELGGLLLGGTTVVISPLLALQRDQLGALQRRDVSAVAVNSSGSARDRAHTLDQLASGAPPSFVFLGPEQLTNVDVVHRLANLHPTLVAIDEAHLVSRWGPDFRPDYLRIAAAVEAIGRPTLLALTATASPPVRDDIVQRLGMTRPGQVIRGFGRPNIELAVHSYFTDDAHKVDVLTEDAVEAVKEYGHGIVYGATHHRVVALAEALERRGVRVAAYHAGLAGAVRTDVEGRFHRGDIDVVVATIAFGMGVDKPDIRWVFHADPSGSLDEYYQEFGRAGRDDGPARATLYFRSEDLRLPRMFAAQTGPSPKSVAAVIAALRNGAATMAGVHDISGLSRDGVGAAMMALVDVGAVAVQADGTVDVLEDLDAAGEKALELVRDRRRIERSRAEMMGAYAAQDGCRWKFLLEYLGEPADERCGHCDNDRIAAENDDSKQPFPRDTRVRHAVFGEGDVIGYAGRGILIEFDHVGYKRLDLQLVLDGDLLEPIDS